MKDVYQTLEKRELREVIVIGNPSWRAGILGLVAGKVTEEYKRPSFVWGEEGGSESRVIKGSCRSDGSANVVELMTSVSTTLIGFGGHKLAGGFSVSLENIHHLEDVLVTAYQNVKQDMSVVSKYAIDATLTLGDVTKKAYRELSALAPFGCENPKPLFLFEHVTVLEMKQFGKEKNHLELTLRDASGSVKAIAFFKAYDSFEKVVVVGEIVSIVAHFDFSFFAGRETLRLRIVDIV